MKSDRGKQAGLPPNSTTIFYAVAMLPPCLLSLAVWSYAAHNNRLIDPHTSQHVRRQEVIRPLAMAGVFLLSIALAFIHDDLAKFSWGLAATIPIFLK